MVSEGQSYPPPLLGTIVLVHEKLSSFSTKWLGLGACRFFGIADATSSTSSVSFSLLGRLDRRVRNRLVVALSPRQGFFVHQPGLCARPSPRSVVVLLPSTHLTKPWTTRDFFFETTTTTTTMRSQTSSFSSSSSSSRYSTPPLFVPPRDATKEEDDDEEEER